MTEPDPTPDPMPAWHAELLRQISRLSAEVIRVSRLDLDGYDGTAADAQADWQHHLNALAGELERTEQVALSAGIPAETITRARLPAHSVNRSSQQVPELPVPHTVPTHVGEFLVDMIAVDQYNLERMVILTAARELRIGQGAYLFGADPASIATVVRNMALLHQRITTMAAAAQITEAEGSRIWGHQIEDWRRMAQATVHRMDDLDLEHAWRHYTIPNTDPSIPLYPGIDPPVATGHTMPPTPSELIAQAKTALGAAGSTTPAEGATEHAPRAGQAIEAALPDEATRSWQPDLNAEHDAQPPQGDAGLDP
ncbi:hypothetical protein ABIA39_007531 [Nocardia sp. GAS34]|uniref:hypothetical protein n=1 Tax=unclassified Nocardia TaxID=2637762 RepID=UPI003D23EDA2